MTDITFSTTPTRTDAQMNPSDNSLSTPAGDLYTKFAANSQALSEGVGNVASGWLVSGGRNIGNALAETGYGFGTAIQTTGIATGQAANAALSGVGKGVTNAAVGAIPAVLIAIAAVALIALAKKV